MLTDNLIDGRAIAREVHAETESRVATLKSDGVEPGLVFVSVGGDSASKVYVGMKERTAARLGIRSETTVLPEDTPEAELLKLLAKLNADSRVHGVLVQVYRGQAPRSRRQYQSQGQMPGRNKPRSYGRYGRSIRVAR